MSQEYEISTAQSVAAEDIRPGDYLTALQIISEHFPIFCETPRLMRTSTLPGRAATPVQVVEVCLPLVLVRTVQR